MRDMYCDSIFLVDCGGAMLKSYCSTISMTLWPNERLKTSLGVQSPALCQHFLVGIYSNSDAPHTWEPEVNRTEDQRKDSRKPPEITHAVSILT